MQIVNTSVFNNKKQMTFRFLFIILVFFSQIFWGQSYKGRATLGLDYTKPALKTALQNRATTQIFSGNIFKDKETAIQISEPILFMIYGKDNIISQRPYETNFIDGYWILNGTLAENAGGGTFLIINNATNGQIIELTHG